VSDDGCLCYSARHLKPHIKMKKKISHRETPKDIFLEGKISKKTTQIDRF